MIINKKTRDVRQDILFNCLKILVIICIFTKIGSYFSEWMNRFPLVRRKVEGKEFSLWANEIKDRVISGFPDVGSIMTDVYNSINAGRLVTIIFALILILYVSVICMNRFVISGKCKSNEKSTRLKGVTVTGEYYCKSVLRSSYLKQNIKYLFGGDIFWIFISFYGGLMTKIQEQKVMFFLVMTCIFYAGLFLSQSLIHRLNAIYTLDGEGKKACFWLDDLGKLLDLKEKIWRLNVVVITAAEYIFFYLCTGSSYVIFAGGLQLVYMSLLLLLYNLPSVIFPYFEYKNKEELVKYCDREKLYDLIDGILLIGVNSVLVIPTALYMTDFMDLGRYLMVQFLIVGVIIVLVEIIVKFYIKKKIRSIVYLQKIYCS